MGLYETRVERLVRWAKGEKMPPVTIELIPTERCNLNCKSCWRRGWAEKQLRKRYEQEMSDKRILKLIEEGAEIGLKEVAFVGGGEPLMRSVTPRIMKEIKTNKMEGDLVTNGTLFNEKIIELLVRIGWDRLKFSIDSPDPKIHDYLRGKKGAFKTAIKNIKSFLKLKKKLKAEKPRLLLNTVISKRNYKLLPDLVELSSEIGVNGIWLLPLTVFDESMRNLKLTEDNIREFKSILMSSIKLAKESGIENNFADFLDPKYIEKTENMDEVMMEDIGLKIKEEYPGFDDPIENFKFLPCYAPWIHITILPNGNIAPCFSPWVWEAEKSVKNHSLKELWFGDYFDKFRNIILERKLPENCKKCCVWEVFNNRRFREGIDRYLKGEFAG
ncbi:MAG: radical SAM protein [Candidatus Aenigmarchaeota archaeon]|nr:radical SAM protein [Candidatus Aenigmarchaeota archaeon]